jgi:hypothetical protein
VSVFEWFSDMVFWNGQGSFGNPANFLASEGRLVFCAGAGLARLEI